jgi:hypothetical protein
VKNAVPTRRPAMEQDGKKWNAKRMDKKKPAVGGLESIFLEEDRGDRNDDGALHQNGPMIIHDD